MELRYLPNLNKSAKPGQDSKYKETTRPVGLEPTALGFGNLRSTN